MLSLLLKGAADSVKQKPKKKKSKHPLSLLYFAPWIRSVPIYLSVMDRSCPPPSKLSWNRENCPYLWNYHSRKINTVHNLITFFIVFTNKIGMDRFCPPPPSSKLRCIYPPSKLRLTLIAFGGGGGGGNLTMGRAILKEKCPCFKVLKEILFIIKDRNMANLPPPQYY